MSQKEKLQSNTPTGKAKMSRTKVTSSGECCKKETLRLIVVTILSVSLQITNLIFSGFDRAIEARTDK
ncbi:MAG TPA: hypothetical protein VLV32_04995 [Burkholderiales bacterium]|nr:hypothetical protein [Burkholderiales bacterium]